MYVCLCRKVTDRCVRAAIDGGARDPEALVRACRAGTGCGGCRESVEALLRAAIVECGDAGQHVEVTEAT